MKNKYFTILLKFKLFYPVLIALLIAIIAFSIIIVRVSHNSIYELAEKNMAIEVATIKKMFERERELKIEKVESDLKVARLLFYQQSLNFSDNWLDIEITNQLTNKSHKDRFRELKWNNRRIYNSTEFINQAHDLFGGTTTIFQKSDSGYVRISTNVLKDNGENAVGTFIPNYSKVVETLNKGGTYYGRAFVVNDWYITAYEPIIINNEIVGALYVGGKEKDIDKLRATLASIKIGDTGFPLVINSKNEIIFIPEKYRSIIDDENLINLIKGEKNKVFYFHSNYNNKKYLVALDYFPDFEFYIAILIPTLELTHTPLKSIVINSIIFGSILLVLIILLIITLTTQRVQRFLDAIRLSNEKLKTTKEALKQSEENFETIFQNSSDEIFVSDIQGNIIEVNDQASRSLKYSRSELLNMNILDIKPLKQAESFLVYRKIILDKGSYLYDSEFISKTGKIIPVETNSRVLEFNGETVILSISRNLAKRQEMERKVLSAVIQTEEKERERFSKDMHDGIGPLLSTIKLYVNELGSADIGEKEKKEFVVQVNRMLDDAVSSIREISNNLMPRVIHEYGLVKALEAFCQKVNQTGKIFVDFITQGIDSSLDKNVQLILFRVISELLTNTIKHAKAKNANIQLYKSSDNISLIFTDDGIGFDSKKVMENKNTGIGLKSIISRIKSINGNVEIYSSEGEGFKITIDI